MDAISRLNRPEALGREGSVFLGGVYRALGLSWTSVSWTVFDGFCSGE